MKQNLIDWVWCFPQTFLGWIVQKVTKAEKHGDHYRYKNSLGSVSLGKYIFLCEGHWNSETTLKHEKGHQVQSYILGPLYLLVIGLPSFLWCRYYDTYGANLKMEYYDFYTEKWADKLGGVERR